MTKVYIINSNLQYDRMFINRGFTLVDTVDKADLVQFTGGADVSPHLYGQSKHPKTSCNPERDVYEMGLYHQALCLGKRMTGICRGAQFLHVMTGGSMYQHIEGHCRNHLIYDEDGRPIEVTSTHHQGMVPNTSTFITDSAGIIIDGDNTKLVDIQEVGCAGSYHREDHGLSFGILMFQPHPEFVEGECQDFYFDLLISELGIEA